MLGVGISTLGRRRRELEALLRDLDQASAYIKAVAIVDQSGAAAAHPDSLRVPRSMQYRLRYGESALGLSRGRNLTLSLLADCTHIWFPNDNARISSEALAVVASRFARDELDGIAGRCLLPDGRLRGGVLANGELSLSGVWQAMEAALILSREATVAVGGFDERIGLGAPTPWQSGEGTELLIRMLRVGARIACEPAFAVEVHAADYALDAADLLRKKRIYGRGTGYVLRTTNLGMKPTARAILGPALRAIKPSSGAVIKRQELQTLLGRIEGLSGRTMRLKIAPPTQNGES